MLPASLSYDQFTLYLVGFLFCVVGLTSLVTHRLGRTLRGVILSAAVSLIFGAYSLLELRSTPNVAILVIVAALPLLLTLATSSIMAQCLCQLRMILHAPAGRAALIFMLGCGMVFAATVRSENDGKEFTLAEIEKPTLSEVFGTGAQTDRGNTIPMLTCVVGHPERVQNNLSRLHNERAHRAESIQLYPAEPTTNCHGWVFTAGQFWVAGSSVDTILMDNGYHVVSQPELGDIVIYRGDDGMVIHSGLVRAIWDNRVLIESKWGQEGIYVHFAEKSPYGQQYTFHHGARKNPVLRGLSTSTNDQFEISRIGDAKCDR